MVIFSTMRTPMKSTLKIDIGMSEMLLMVTFDSYLFV
jgi:hypothetical protein